MRPFPRSGLAFGRKAVAIATADMVAFLLVLGYTAYMEKMFDVVIVGGGPAGLSAAVYAARSGVTVAVAEALTTGGVAATTPVIENYPGYESVSGFDLAQKMAEQAQRCGAEIVYGNVTKIEDGACKKVTLSSGDVLTGKALVLAMGNVPRKLGVPREDELLGAGVSYCATCDGNFFRNKTVAVAGGGRLARASVEYLLPLAKKVYWIADTALPDAAGAEKIEKAKIVALHGMPLQSVTLLKGDKERELAVDGLFVSLGYVPAVGLVRDLVATDAAGYIVCDEQMRTNREGIFAAGDARSKPLRQIVTAAADGAIAGQFAAVYAKKNKSEKN